MHVQILVFCIMDTFEDLDKYPVCSTSQYKYNAGYYGRDIQSLADGNKRKRKDTARNSVVSVVLDATSGLSKKQSIIPAMVMWYLPVSDRL